MAKLNPLDAYNARIDKNKSTIRSSTRRNGFLALTGVAIGTIGSGIKNPYARLVTTTIGLALGIRGAMGLRNANDLRDTNRALKNRRNILLSRAEKNKRISVGLKKSTKVKNRRRR